jgi:hypothetical protein
MHPGHTVNIFHSFTTALHKLSAHSPCSGALYHTGAHADQRKQYICMQQ